MDSNVMTNYLRRQSNDGVYSQMICHNCNTFQCLAGLGFPATSPLSKFMDFPTPRNELLLVNKEDNVQCMLLASKSKVAPLKQVSLPPLELCDAVTLARLTKRIRQTLCLENVRCFCWTDSTITLACINEPPITWKTYVANRVSEIQTRLSDAVWLHMPRVENLADLPSRGVLASDLAKSSTWIPDSWNRSSLCDIDEPHETLERRSVACFVTCTIPLDPDVITKFSSLSRLVNTIACCLQFLQRARSRIEAHGAVWKITQENYQVESLPPRCLILLALVHWVQHIYFVEENSCLEKGDSLPRKSVLIRLYPILDAQKHLRVSGRLRHSLLHPDERHPLILPQKSNLTKLLVLDAHSKTLHKGTQLTLNYHRTSTQEWTMRDPFTCDSQKVEVQSPTKCTFASLSAFPPVQSTSRQNRKNQAKVGDLCMLRSELYPPSKWPLARITAYILDQMLWFESWKLRPHHSATPDQFRRSASCLRRTTFHQYLAKAGGMFRKLPKQRPTSAKLQVS